MIPLNNKLMLSDLNILFITIYRFFYLFYYGIKLYLIYILIKFQLILDQVRFCILQRYVYPLVYVALQNTIRQI